MHAQRAWMPVLLIAVGAILVAWLVTSRVDETFPTGSARSGQADGAAALFLWAEALGAQPVRLGQPGQDAPDPRTIALVFVIQPVVPIGEAHAALLDDVASHGGTVVVAGDTLAAREYLARRGVTLAPAPRTVVAVDPADGEPFPLTTRNQISGLGLDPLVETLDGRWVGARTPYQGGTLVALATPDLLTNASLRDPGAARLVYRRVMAPAVAGGGLVVFDERASAAVGEINTSPESVLFQTPVGRGLAYAAVVLFLYVALASRRLGPALPAARAERAARSRFEYVQAMAGLYRRARQLAYARAHFAHQARRAVTRALGVDVLAAGTGAGAVQMALQSAHLQPEQAAGLDEALRHIDTAASDRELIAAVARAEDALRRLPRSRDGTLSPA